MLYSLAVYRRTRPRGILRSAATGGRMDTHVKVVGVLDIVFGIIGICVAMFLTLVFAGAMTAVFADGDPDAAVAIPIIGLSGAALVAFLVVWSLPGIIIGFGLLKRKPWARVGGIVVAIVALLNIPIGTIFGVYSLWMLFSKDTEKLFSPQPATTPLGS